ncbi:SidA/IucD/PvdA family monooxygenase [Streptomyces xanthochromogenes]|uniref:lysine N(6)-hydroxylase/L-ornithine N(5)-oxygenase family protein n=1 Tax=Streptomyces xanthochromogenes TaxID=67384 RepID=UPI0034286DA5
MSPSPAAVDATPVHDLVGIGFGPSNLALAVAVREHNETAAPHERLTPVFVERQRAFGWHRGMLIEGATMQVSFLKDLATMRNPVSRHSFLSYLQDKGRLVDFINHKEFFPTREEFHDYLSWAAAGFDDQVSYGEEVVRVGLTADADGTPLFEVVSQDVSDPGRTTSRLARHVVVAVGLTPYLPDGVTESKRIWHSGNLLHELDRHETGRARRFVVVGAGQSAAEIAEYLHRSHPGAELCAVFSRYGYSPSDDSPYANRIFDPEAVDVYYEADDALKRRLMGYHRNTNYAVADLDLIEELYRRAYQEKVRGEERLRILNVSRVVRAEDLGDQVTVTVEHLPSGSTERFEADAVVYATGYRPTDLRGLLSGLESAYEWDADGRPLLDRDYRMRGVGSVPGGLFLQGGTEHTHGITSSLLSLAAVRAGEILDSVLAGRPAPGRDAAANR